MTEEKYTPEIIWQIFAESKKEANKLNEQMEKMFAAADKRFAETERIIKENSAETERMIKENSAETERMIKENSAETERVIKENSDETNKKIKELTRNIGGISDSNGLMAHQTICNTLAKDMKFAEIEFDDMIQKQKKHSKKLNLKGEYDVILENGDTIALIEIKYKFKKTDLEKLATTQVDSFRKLFPKYSNYKIILGIGGISFEDDVEEEAKENGIGVIKIINDKVEYFTDKIKIY